MSEQKEKTVYVLGAGFSAAANFPTQARILELLLERISYSFSGIFPLEVEQDFHQQLDESIRQISEFIKTCFPDSDQPLEDIFTLLDQTIQTKGHFRGYKQFDLLAIRSKWIELISGFFHALSTRYLASNENLYQRFSAHLLEKRMQQGQESDPVSVISLNWDTLLEDAFAHVLKKADGIRKADIDYCVYTAALDDSPHIPSPKQKAAGLFNFKVLKMHGSINWLRCPNSNHLYTALGSSKNAYDLYLHPRESPFIAEQYPDESDQSSPPLLEPYLITPTYTKVFDQPHIQTTWHNAYVELREATRVVFIGYSLPEADYHFRTLLRRAIRQTTEIEVILYETDYPPDFEADYGAPASWQSNASFAIDRYRRLFGRDRVDGNASFDGVQSFVDRVMPKAEYDKALERMRNGFKRHVTAEELFNNAKPKPTI